VPTRTRVPRDFSETRAHAQTFTVSTCLQSRASVPQGFRQCVYSVYVGYLFFKDTEPRASVPHKRMLIRVYIYVFITAGAPHTRQTDAPTTQANRKYPQSSTLPPPSPLPHFRPSPLPPPPPDTTDTLHNHRRRPGAPKPHPHLSALGQH